MGRQGVRVEIGCKSVLTGWGGGEEDEVRSCRKVINIYILKNIEGLNTGFSSNSFFLSVDFNFGFKDMKVV